MSNNQELPVRPAPGTELCTVEEIPDGGGRVLAIGPTEMPFRVIVLRSGEQVIAWHNRCPHFGQPLALKDEWLILRPHASLSCNVHYARFRWADGICESGDCEGEGLTAVAIEIRDGKILLRAD